MLEDGCVNRASSCETQLLSVARPRLTVFSSFFDVWVVTSVNTLYIKGIYVMLRDEKKVYLLMKDI